jgi:hypothetical protein
LFLSREKFHLGEAVWAVEGRLLDIDVLTVTSAVTPGWRGDAIRVDRAAWPSTSRG